jgi:glycosyltransferase involved in cell wall biosynthesis
MTPPDSSAERAVAASVLVCTRNRPADLERAVRSLLASTGIDFELIVIDQSDGSEAAQVLHRLPDEGRLRYIRSDTRGVGKALAEGLAAARSPFIVRTDDDCEAPPEWVAGMVEALRSRERVAVVFCNVVAAPFDPNTGYTPICDQNPSRLVRSVFSSRPGFSLGAGMAFRRDAVVEVGGFDEALGPGCRFPACEDWDIELRVILRGWEALHSADLSIVHHGFRTFAEGRVHIARDWLGIGAELGKLIRAGHPSALVLTARCLGVQAILPALMQVFNLRRPQGLRKITSFCRGFSSAVTLQVDRRTMLFITDD